jgi:hypothetical protein
MTYDSGRRSRGDGAGRGASRCRSFLCRCWGLHAQAHGNTEALRLSNRTPLLAARLSRRSHHATTSRRGTTTACLTCWGVAAGLWWRAGSTWMQHWQRPARTRMCAARPGSPPCAPGRRSPGNSGRYYSSIGADGRRAWRRYRAATASAWAQMAAMSSGGDCTTTSGPTARS